MFTITDQITVPGTGYFLEDWKIVTQEFRLSDDTELPASFATVDSAGNFTLNSPDIYKRRIKVFAEQPFGVTWEPEMTIQAGDYVRSTVSDKYIYKAGGAGTTGLTEPTWNAVHEETTTDNGIVFTAVAYLGKGPNNGKIWQGEYESQAGDEAVLAHDHVDTLLSYPFNETGRLADNARKGIIALIGEATSIPVFTAALKINANSASDGLSTDQVFSWGSHNIAFFWNHTSAAHHCAGAIQDSGGTWYTAKIDPPPAAGSEVAIIITYDGTDLKIYENKILRDTTTVSITPNLSHNDILIGNWGDYDALATNAFDGTVLRVIVQDVAWDQSKVDAFVDHG